jgi:hypothetical protein
LRQTQGAVCPAAYSRGLTGRLAAHCDQYTSARAGGLPPADPASYLSFVSDAGCRGTDDGTRSALSTVSRVVNDDSTQMGDVVHVDFRNAGELNLEKFVASQLSGDLTKVLGYERTDIADLIAGDYAKCLARVRDLFAFSLKFESNDIPVEQAEITRRVVAAAVRVVGNELSVIRDEIAVEMGSLAHAVMVHTAVNLNPQGNGPA